MGVSYVPIAKGLSRWFEQSPLPPARVLVSLTLTLTLPGFGFLSPLSPHTPLAVGFFSLPACYFLLGRGRLELMALSPYDIPHSPHRLRTLSPNTYLSFPFPKFKLKHSLMENARLPLMYEVAIFSIIL